MNVHHVKFRLLVLLLTIILTSLLVPANLQAEGGSANKLPVKVIFKTTMDLNPVSADQYIFTVNGQEQAITGIEATANFQDGCYGFNCDFNLSDGESTDDAEVKLIEIVDRGRFDLGNIFSVLDSNYDKSEKVLRVTLGRRIKIAVTDIQNIRDHFNDGGFAIPGFSLGLYSSINPTQLIAKSHYENYSQTQVIDKLQPGSYFIKILGAPEPYKSEYDLDKTYQLEIKQDGTPLLEIYTKNADNSAAYQLASMWGGTAWALKPHLQGIKTLFILPIAPNKLVEKSIYQNSQDIDQVRIGKNDIVEFHLKKEISPDHNTIIYSAVENSIFLNAGTYVDQSFKDVLDSRLEFVEGSLNLSLDGEATQEYDARYDAQTHSIVVEDHTHPNIIAFDMSTLEVPPAQKLVVSFKVHVHKADDTIINTVDESTVKLLPIKVEGHKTWQDNDIQDHTRPDRITIRLLADGVEVDKKQVTASDNWSWSFSDLPRVDSAGQEITYTIQEDEVDHYASVIDGYDVTNTYTPTNPPPTNPSPTNPSPTEPSVVPPPELTVPFPQVFKMIKGEKPSQADVFTFQLEPISYRALESSSTLLSPDSLPMPRGSEVGRKLATIRGEGVSNFGEVTYTRTGIYTYRITEVVNTALPYQFSNLVYTLTDQVYEEGGQLFYQRALSREDSNDLFTTAYFVNIYNGPSPLREKVTSLPATGEKVSTPFILLCVLGVCLFGVWKKRNL